MVDEISRHIDGFHAAEIIRDGFEVVILGAPNAGKSSLFNALARREAAIVTDEPGTTRDLLEVVLDLNGVRVRVTDTAGLREAPGKVEAIGIEKAREKARTGGPGAGAGRPGEPSRDRGHPGRYPGFEDRHQGRPAEGTGGRGVTYDAAISTMDGPGLAELLADIGARAAAAIGDAGDILPSRLRHVELLNETKRFLARLWRERSAGRSCGRKSCALLRTGLVGLLALSMSRICST